MKNKLLLTCLIIFFAVMIIAIIVAENIYYDSLPTVFTGLVTEDKLRAKYSAAAKLEYVKEQYKYNTSFDFSYVELLAENMEPITQSSPLYRIPADEALLMKKRLELSALDLKVQNEQLISGSSVSRLSERNKLQYDINALQIEAIESQIEMLERLCADDGMVYADQDGIVNYSVTQGASVRGRQEIAVISVDTGKRVVTWQMPANKGQLFGAGNRVDALLTVSEPSEKTSEKNEAPPTIKEAYYSLRISESEFSSLSQSYSFTAEILDDVLLSMDDGEQVILNCSYISSDDYPFVVPASAITFESEARGYIYYISSRQKVYGKEHYVSAYYVEIERILDDYCALYNAPAGYDIVFHTTKPLSDSMAVKLAVPLE